MKDLSLPHDRWDVPSDVMRLSATNSELWANYNLYFPVLNEQPSGLQLSRCQFAHQSWLVPDHISFLTLDPVAALGAQFKIKPPQ
jgi:hypothetical protein